jgi:hypothetical protein
VYPTWSGTVRTSADGMTLWRARKEELGGKQLQVLEEGGSKIIWSMRVSVSSSSLKGSCA